MPANRETLIKQQLELPENSALTPSVSCRQVSSADLLGGGDVLRIQHQGDAYLLRQTRAGKLILTK